MNFESGQIGDLGSAANQFLQQMHGHLMHKLNIVPSDPCPDAPCHEIPSRSALAEPVSSLSNRFVCLALKIMHSASRLRFLHIAHKEIN
jgi:hypothetical protein